MKEKVILAYSGGLDTTAIIPWLKENFDYEVICVCIDCGQGEELDGLEERAKFCGASKLYIEDVVDEFCDEYVVPCVQAHAVYENKYLLGTSMARPVIAKRLVEIARKEGATAICHGATGKGNDQIRFELGIKALAPDLKIIAAWRSDKWTMDSRESEIEYCKAHGIDLPFSADSSYSRDRNLWHISHEGLELEDPANEPNFDHLLVLGTTPEKAPDEGEYVTMTFEAGVPKSVNGKEMKVSDIIRTLNELGGKHGIGIVDIVENRVVGMKSRGVYETPGGTILYEAHQQLEELILDRDTTTLKMDMGNKLAQICYEGKWFSPLREAVQAFIESTQKYVTGALVEGGIAAHSIVQKLNEEQVADTAASDEEAVLENKIAEYDAFLTKQNPAFTVEELEEAMQKVMDQYAGGIGTHYQFNEKQLAMAEEKIKKLQILAKGLAAADMHELMFIYELKERLTVCLTVIAHLRARKETRWHSFAENLDYPEKSDAWLCYVNSKKNGDQITMIRRDLVKGGETYEHRD